MAVFVPLASSANVIENILFKVRRGIALSRNASQANPNTGVMVDLPEKIDFDMTILKTYQSSSFQRIVDVTALESGCDSRASSSSESSATRKTSIDLEGTTSSEQAGSQDSDQTKRDSNSVDGGSESSNESTSGSEGEGSNEKGNGKSNSNSKENAKGNGNSNEYEIENRCTYQKHDANREYDKFDTDTGKIEGISI